MNIYLESILEGWRKILNSAKTLLLKFARNFKPASWLAVLSLLAAIASAVATWYSYRASDQSAQAAIRQQEFVERVNRDQLALARPSLSVLEGKLEARTEGEGYKAKTSYWLDLVIHNAGARSAQPAWIGVYDDWLSSALVTRAYDIPSSKEIRVVLEIGERNVRPRGLLVALGYADWLPDASSSANAPLGSELVARCAVGRVVQLVPAAQSSDASVPVSATPWTPRERTEGSRQEATPEERAQKDFEEFLRSQAQCAAGKAKRTS